MHLLPVLLPPLCTYALVNRLGCNGVNATYLQAVYVCVSVHETHWQVTTVKPTSE